MKIKKGINIIGIKEQGQYWVTLDDMKEFIRKEMDYLGVSDEHIENVLRQLEKVSDDE